MIALHNNHSGVPFIEFEWLVVGCRDKVVKRTEFAVALHTKFCIGVEIVVENLEFTSDSRPFAFVEIGVNEILDTAVGTGSDFEVDFQDEVGILRGCDDVAAVSRFGAGAFEHFQHAIFDNPPFFGEFVEFSATPAVCGLSVPEEFPSVGLFLFCESVRLLRSNRSGANQSYDKKCKLFHYNKN